MDEICVEVFFFLNGSLYETCDFTKSLLTYNYFSRNFPKS